MSFTEKALRWTVIVGVFALPFVAIIVAYNLFFPYITGKNFTFRVLVELMAGAWLALALTFSRYRPQRGWILAAFALFVAVLAVADAFGAVPWKSFWSNYERMEGWVTLAHLLLYLCVLVSIVNVEKIWRQLWQWTLAISLFISALGVMQVLNLATFGGGTSGLSARIDATFGNPIYLAVYMLFVVFIAALLWVEEGSERWRMSERALFAGGPLIAIVVALLYGGAGMSAVAAGAMLGAYAILMILVQLLMFASKRYLLAFVIVVDTFALLFTGTRGATLGLIGGAFLALLVYACSSGVSKRFRLWTAGAFTLLIVCTGGLWLARDTSFIRNIGFLDRLASISLSDDTTMARLINIQIAWKGIEERPILGWGQENFAVVFDKYYDPRMYAQEQWFDRVHDSVFDWWIAGGTLGLLAYLSIFLATLWTLWRSPGFGRAERAVLIGLVAGYFAQNLTVFDNITSWIFFLTVLGFIVYRHASAVKARVLIEKEFVPRAMLVWVSAACLVIALGSVWIINEPAYAANVALISALQPQQGGAAANLALFEKSISYNTFGAQEAREQLAQIAMQVVASNSVSSDLKQQFVQTAVSELDNQAALSPLDARFPLFAGGVLDAAGDYTDAATYLAKAHALSPDKQSILAEMGQTALTQGDTQDALTYFKTAYELDTNDTAALIDYTAALISVGDEAQAEPLLAPLIPTGQAANDEIDSAYVSRGEYSKLIPIWQAFIAQDPSDAKGYETLAAVYYGAHDNANAITTLKALEAAVPSDSSQAEQMMQQIQSGTSQSQ